MEVLNYINTLIMALVMAALSVVLLVTMFLEAMQPYVTLMATVLAGALGLTIWLLWRIITYDKRLNASISASAKRVVKSAPCPNYFVRSKDGRNNDVCTGSEVTLDSGDSTNKRTYTFGTASNASVNLTDLLSGSDRTVQAVCTDSNVISAPYAWTDLVAQCP